MFRRSSNNTTPSTSFKSQSGAMTAISVFGIMAFLLVIALSLADRTKQEIELAGQQEDTTRVFNAAESGVEEALSNESYFTGAVPSPTPISDVQNQTETKLTITAEDEYQNTFQPGLSATVFTNNSSNDLTIKWAADSESGCSSAVLIVTAYIQTGANYSAQHFGLRPQGCYDTTKFEPVDEQPNIASREYRYSKDFTVPAGTQMLRIKPLYAATTLLVDGNALGNQLHTIRSEANDTSTGNTEVRTVEVTRTRPAPPLILDYALYSGGSLTK